MSIQSLIQSERKADLIAQIREEVADLQNVNPWFGLARFTLLGILLSVLLGLAWQMEMGLGLIGVAAIAGIVYAFLFVCTHDMVHRTLTGWNGFDGILSRAISYPMFWCYGVYTELHALHHGWNGIDLRDPERIEWSITEYERASPLLQFYVRHQWIVDIFILGGIGLIFKTLWHGYTLRQERPHLSQQLAIDLGSMAIFHGIAIYLVYSADLLGKYILIWFVLERTMGIILQTRDHLEHYGLWHRQSNYLLTQLYTCRNLRVNPLTNWLMGGLPYHAIHHCFPQIPFNLLPIAYHRIQALLARCDYPPLVTGQGYVAETLSLISAPSLIQQAQGNAIATNHQSLNPA
jgi:fatty acid desaturase